MMDDIDSLFANLKKVPEPAGLAERVAAKVFEREHQHLSRLISAVYAGLLSSLVFLVWSISLMIKDFSNSPAYALAHIIISDFGAVRDNLSNWGLAIIESISLDALLPTVFGIFIFVVLVNKLVRLEQTNRRAPKKWPGGIHHGVIG